MLNLSGTKLAKLTLKHVGLIKPDLAKVIRHTNLLHLLKNMLHSLKNLLQPLKNKINLLATLKKLLHSLRNMLDLSNLTLLKI